MPKVSLFHICPFQLCERHFDIRFLLHLCTICSHVHGRPGGDDSDDGVPPASLGWSSLEAATDPPRTHDGMGEATSHSAPSATHGGGGPEVLMVEVGASAMEDMENRGRQTSPGHKKLEPDRLVSSAPATLESPGRTGTSPAPPPGGDAGRTPSPMLGPKEVELPGRRREVEVALTNSSILPEHRAMLGMAFTQF